MQFLRTANLTHPVAFLVFGFGIKLLLKNQKNIMKKLLLFIALIPFLGFSQPVDFSSKSFDFQSVYNPNTDSLKLTLSNTSGFDIAVEGITVFSIYETKPFFVKDSIFTMNSGSSHDVWIYFSPEQNILHQMYAVVHTDFRGDYLIELTGKGKYFNSYYDNTYNKSEQDLKTAMKSITTSGHVDLGYSGARDKMFMNMDNKKVNGQGASDNTIEGVYTGQLIIGYTSRTDAQNQGFNTEHTFPQGFFNSAFPMKSDLHHLFPTNATANSQRGNYPFGVVTGTPTWSVGGSKVGGGKFEPRDVQKGQVARALFYFVVRYQDYSNHVLGQESILRQWMDEYPVTKIDSLRNEDIDTYQKNRNPFIDYPQFIKRITKISGNSVAVPVKSIFVSRDTVDMRFEKDSLVYTVSIVNTGNDLVTLTDFAISNTTNFHFENAMSDVGLLPGEGMEVEVAVNPQSNVAVSEQLTFNTDAVGMSTVSIALLGEWETVSVNETEFIEELKLYPNPSSNRVAVSWGNKANFELQIYTLLGELVSYEMVRGTTTTVDVSSLSNGVYIVKATSGESVKQLNLVVQ